MRKIELTRETENKHMKYFKEQILPNIINSRAQIYIPSSKEVKLLKEDPYRFAKKFRKQHCLFVGFIEKKCKLFAIGRKHELERINNEIANRFPLVNKMIQLKDTGLKNTYKDYLYGLFGYEKFETKDMYHYIKQKAQTNVNKKQYCEEVCKEMVRILEVNYPDQTQEIRDALLPSGILLSPDKCKAAFRKLHHCNITMGNFRQHDIFCEEWNDYAFVMESGVRVCPYCNRQYITPIFSDSGKMRADIDHFLPKSVFPYFSMSLYNLVPVCKSCNQSLKRDREFNFDSISPYEDHIGDYFRFKANVQTNEISIKVNGDTSNIMQHLDVFKIEALYNYHRNQVKELIFKRVTYPDDYIQKLYEENKAYFNSVHEVKQLIIGFIDDKSRLNDEAFLKLRRDVAEQLGFLSTRNDFRIAKLKEIIENGKLS